MASLVVGAFVVGACASGAVARQARPGLSAASTRSAGGGTELWIARYDNTAATGLAASRDGAFVVGSTTNFPSGSGFITIGYDTSTGKRLWLRRPGNPIDGFQANAVAVSPDGTRVFVTGYGEDARHPEGGIDFITVAYEAVTGKRLWRAVFTGHNDGNPHPTSLAVSLDGTKVFEATQAAPSLVSEPDIATLAYDTSTGKRLWLRRYTHASSNGDAQVAVSPDETRVFVSGMRAQTIGGRDHLTIAYSADTGATLWQRYNPGEPHWLNGGRIAVSRDGTRVAVTNPTVSGAITMSYDSATGQRLWDVPAAHGGAGIAYAPDGSSVFVSGGGVTAYEPASGVQQWANHSHPGSLLAVAPDGSRVYLTGGNGHGLVTIAYQTS